MVKLKQKAKINGKDEIVDIIAESIMDKSTTESRKPSLITNQTSHQSIQVHNMSFYLDWSCDDSILITL